MKEYKATINASLTLTEGNHIREDVLIEGSVGLEMKLIAILIAEIEKSIPESRRAQFRADMLATINAVREERIDNNVHS